MSPVGDANREDGKARRDRDSELALRSHERHHVLVLLVPNRSVVM